MGGKKLVMIKKTPSTKELTEENQILKIRLEQLKTEKETGIRERASLVKAIICGQKAQALGELSLNLGHEIRNFLAAIELRLDLIRLGLSEKPEEDLETALKTVQQTKNLVSSMMNFGSKKPIKKIAKIQDIVKETILPYKIKKAILGIEIETCFESNVSTETIPVEIIQIIINILRNSIQSLESRKNPRIKVIVRDISLNSKKEKIPIGEYVMLKISDNGCGIKPNILNRIFEPNVTGQEIGNGIGMSVVKELVSKNKGYITIDTKEGFGTSITIYFPAS